MLTTDGEACRNKAMVDFSSAKSSPLPATALGAARGSLSDALLTHESLKSRIAIAEIATAAQIQAQAERRVGLESVRAMRAFETFGNQSCSFAKLNHLDRRKNQVKRSDVVHITSIAKIPKRRNRGFSHDFNKSREDTHARESHCMRRNFSRSKKSLRLNTRAHRGAGSWFIQSRTVVEALANQSVRTSILRGLACSALGSLSVRTPCLSSADIFA